MITRRGALQGAAFLGGCFALSPGAWAETPRLPRRSITSMQLNDPAIVDYEAAVGAMQSFAPTHRYAWHRFVETHRAFCPHSNWFFLPWHRRFLAQFELVCQDILDKPTFRLPYWDWSSDPMFPQAFGHGALFHPGRDVAAGDRLFSPSLAPPVIRRILATPLFESFASGRARDLSTPSRTAPLEGVHGEIHGLIGGDMAYIDMSPNDPIFWLHHANVDRLWWKWNLRNKNTADALWLDFASPEAMFVGVHGNKRFRVSNSIDLFDLGYRYEPEEGDLESGEPQPPRHRKFVPTRAIAREGLLSTSPSPAKRQDDDLESGDRDTAPSIEEQNETIARLLNVPARSKRGELEGTVSLALLGLQVPPEPATLVRVFVGTATSETFVGTVSFFATTHKANHGHRTEVDATFDVTEPLTKLRVRSLDEARVILRSEPPRRAPDAAPSIGARAYSITIFKEK